MHVPPARPPTNPERKRPPILWGPPKPFARRGFAATRLEDVAQAPEAGRALLPLPRQAGAPPA